MVSSDCFADAAASAAAAGRMKDAARTCSAACCGRSCVVAAARVEVGVHQRFLLLHSWALLCVVSYDALLSCFGWCC